MQADGALHEAITETFARLAESPAVVVMAELEAACAVNERPNMPSSNGKYPNWSLALPMTIEELMAATLPQQLAQILNRRTEAKSLPSSASEALR